MNYCLHCWRAAQPASSGGNHYILARNWVSSLWKCRLYILELLKGVQMWPGVVLPLNGAPRQEPVQLIVICSLAAVIGVFPFEPGRCGLMHAFILGCCGHRLGRPGGKPSWPQRPRRPPRTVPSFWLCFVVEPNSLDPHISGPSLALF